MGLSFQRGGAWRQVGVADSIQLAPGVGFGIPQQQYDAVSFNSGITANLLLNAARHVVRDVTIDQIGVYVSVANASSVVRLGVYAANSNGQPGDLIFDAGTVAADTTGEKFITLSPAVRLNAGMVFAAVVAQGASCSVRGAQRAGSLPVPTDSTVDFFNDRRVQTPYEAGVSGALPSTFTLTGFAGSNTPLVWMRVAEVL